jgi:hypothetical protein
MNTFSCPAPTKYGGLKGERMDFRRKPLFAVLFHPSSFLRISNFQVRKMSNGE